MRLLLVIEALGVGGSEQALLYLLPELKRHGVETEVAVLFDRLDLAPGLEKVGIPVHPLRLLHRWSQLEAAAKLGGLARKLKVDVVHGKLFFAGLAVSLSRLVAPKPARVVSFHNLSYDYEGGMSGEIHRQADRWILPRCIDGFAALSQAVAECHRRALGLSDIRVIPNAVPASEFQPWDTERINAFRLEHHLPLDAPVVSMPARLVREKGHEVMLAALRLMQRDDSPVHLVIAGAGPEAASIRAQVSKLAHPERVTLWLDGVPPKQARDLMAASDLVVVPSHFEGFGLAPAEAMAQQTAVVASTAGGLTDLIETGVSGQLVAPNDVVGLKEALTHLILNPDERRRLAQGGRARILERFDTPKVAAQWVEFYSSLIGPR